MGTPRVPRECRAAGSARNVEAPRNAPCTPGDDGVKKNAGLAPTKARPALHTNFCSTKSEEPTESSSLTLIGLSTANEQFLTPFEKIIFRPRNA